MSLPADVAQAIGAATGSMVADAAHVAGGDINQARRIRLHDDRTLFVKFHVGADPTMFPAEADGLRWLAQADALPVPGVVAVAAPEEHTQWLLMEWIAPGRPGPRHQEQLGTGLAELHLAGAAGFGLNRDNFIGSLPQGNRTCADWATFYRDRRLIPQVELGERSGWVDHAVRRDLDVLCERLPTLVGPPEPPARLHGDLWSGNIHTGPRGRPVLIDPAVYGGHREVDLAMLRLFGAPGDRLFAAYQERAPLAEGFGARVPLYQLYPLLVHANLFGGHYAGMVARSLRDLVR